MGSSDLSKANTIYLNDAQEAAGAKFPMTRRVERLAAFTAPKDACSACYGSLIYGLPPVCIGQGYKGQSGAIGVGQCTRSCEKSLPGCPPKAADMAAFLRENWIS